MEEYTGQKAEDYARRRLDFRGTDGPALHWMWNNLHSLSSVIRAKQERVVTFDLGSGAGRWKEIQEEMGLSVVAIESHRDMLEQVPGKPLIHKIGEVHAAEISPGTVIHVEDDFMRAADVLPGQADIAFACFVLTTAQDPQKALAVLNRMLKPGGHALLSTDVFVQRDELPTHQSPKSVDVQKPGIIRTHQNGQRLALRVLLNLPGNPHYPIRSNTAQVPFDYRPDPALWASHEAFTVDTRGMTLVDGADRDANMQYFGDHPKNVVSIMETDARLTQMVMQLTKHE